MAQTGNSCSNPYVMNLSNDTISNQISIASTDTIFYISLTGFSNKVHLKMKLDTTSQNCFVSNWQVKTNNCGSAQKIADRIYYARFEEIDGVIDLSGYDTVKIIITKSCIIDTLNNINDLIITFRLNNLLGGSPTSPCTNIDCGNLLKNPSFEGFSAPTTPVLQVLSWHPFYDNYVCFWTNEESSAYYFNQWFNTNGCLNLMQTTGGCNNAGLNNLSASCGYPEQQGNLFFPPPVPTVPGAYSGLQFGDNINWASGVLGGELTTLLDMNKEYYVEANIAHPKRTHFGGKIDFDISADANFLQANYTSTTPITLSSPGLDWDPNNGWTKLNTIYTPLSPNEQYLHIGNLTLEPVVEQVSGTFTFPLCANNNGGAVAHIFDNLVVKEFLADAGNTDIIICTGSTIGGNTCNFFPNGIYEWLPANLFANNTVYHPTFIGTSNATVSLTVSILMEDGTTQVTDPAYVNITIGPTISIFGNTTIISGSTTTLTATGALTYTWYDNNNNIVWTDPVFITPNLNQTTTYTLVGLDANGCSSTIYVDVNIIPLTCGNHNNTVPIFDGMTSTQLKDYIYYYYPNNISQLSSGGGVSTFQITSYAAPDDINFLLAGTLIIENSTGLKFNFTGPNVIPINFDCFDASNIINNGILEMVSCSLVACNNMWKGIENNKKLHLNGCYFADAENAVHLRNGSIYNINTNVFDNNLYGIFMGGLNGGQISGVDYSNIYRNPTPLKPQYSDMQGYKNRSEAGIKVFNISYVQIGAVPSSLGNYAAITVCNRFEDINCGISIYNSDVKVVNSKFNNISALNTSPAGATPGLVHNGAAIFANSFSNRTITVQPIPGYLGYEFENCVYGIKTYRNSVISTGLKIKTVKYGFDLQNSINCNYLLNDNEIENYKVAGINILQADTAIAIDIRFNHIQSNIAYNKGIKVTGAVGALTGNCYIANNVVQVGSDASGGIEVSGIHGAVIQSNHVKKIMYYIQNNPYGFNGYAISHCKDAVVNCNYATRDANGGSNVGSDYRFNIAENCLIKCNNSGASPYGFDFRGPQAGTIFRTNTMGSHHTGLYIGTSGEIGPQPTNIGDPTEGNKWTGTYTSGYGARNEAIDPNDPLSVAQHKFLTKTSDGAEFNPNVSPPIWFNTSPETHVTLCGSSCPMVRSPVIGNTGFYQAIANGTLTTTDYPVETLWMLQGTLYEYLSNDPDLLQQNDSLALFYFSPHIAGIKDLKVVKDALKQGAIDCSPIFIAMHGNDSLMSEKANEIALYNDSVAADTLNDSLLINQLNIKMAQYLFLEQANLDLYDLLSEIQALTANMAYEQNEEVEPGNVNEAIEKDVNEIYLRTLALGEPDFSAGDITLLYNIDNLCPLAAGPSVYHARDIYALINDTLQYSDSAVCAFEGYYRESANTLYPSLSKKENKINYIKAQPNPASEKILFTLGENESFGHLTIYDVSGAIVFSSTINAGINKLTVDVTNFLNGVYIAHFVNNKVSSRIKLAVSK